MCIPVALMYGIKKLTGLRPLTAKSRARCARGVSNVEVAIFQGPAALSRDQIATMMYAKPTNRVVSSKLLNRSRQGPVMQLRSL